MLSIIQLHPRDGLNIYQTWETNNDLRKYRNFSLKIVFNMPIQHKYRTYDRNFDFFTNCLGMNTNLNYNLIKFEPQKYSIQNNTFHGYIVKFDSQILLSNLMIQYINPMYNNKTVRISFIELYGEEIELSNNRDCQCVIV